MSIVGRTYLDPGDRMGGRFHPPRSCTVLTQWGRGGGPRTVLVRYEDDTQSVIPFQRRLRKDHRDSPSPGAGFSDPTGPEAPTSGPPQTHRDERPGDEVDVPAPTSTDGPESGPPTGSGSPNLHRQEGGASWARAEQPPKPPRANRGGSVRVGGGVSRRPGLRKVRRNPRPRALGPRPDAVRDVRPVGRARRRRTRMPHLHLPDVRTVPTHLIARAGRRSTIAGRLGAPAQRTGDMDRPAHDSPRQRSVDRPDWKAGYRR